MARLKNKDLPEDQKISKEEIKGVFGGVDKNIGDPKDRYSNLETPYLLLKVEKCNNIATLASNLTKAS